MLISHSVTWDTTELPTTFLFSTSFMYVHTGGEGTGICVPVWEGACVCVRVHVHTRTHTHGGPKSSMGVILQELSTLFSETQSLTGTKGWLVGQLACRIHLSLPFSAEIYKCMLPSWFVFFFFNMRAGYQKLRSSGLSTSTLPTEGCSRPDTQLF